MKHDTIKRLLPAILALLLIPLAFGASPASAQGNCRTFPETGFSACDRILQFWDQNGGLPVFGYPVGPQHPEQVGNGIFQVQQFERNRLELHPENKAPYDVLLGRLGADAFGSQDWTTWPKAVPVNDSKYFPGTGHFVPDIFWDYWTKNCLKLKPDQQGCTINASLALFGLPLTEANLERTADGSTHLVQWFERAKFEYHEENRGTPYQVLLGRLGAEKQTVVYPSHFAYSVPRANTHTLKFASKTTDATYILEFQNGGLAYRRDGDMLNTLVITGETKYAIADGLIVYFFEPNIEVDIEPAKWELAF